MRTQLASVGVVVFVVTAMAQTPSTPNLNLVGDRFKPLTYDKLTPAQKTMADHLLAGERRGMGGPFNVLLRSPELGDLAQQVGAQVRFHSSLPKKLNEFAIIMTARHWTAQYEWYAHKRAALEAGLNPAIVVDLIGVIGYYQLVSMILNVDRYPLPDGAKPELVALK
jgi:hypothetical protein